MSQLTQPSVIARTGDDVVAGNLYDKYHTSNPIARHLMAGFLSAFDSLFSLELGENALEVGCGEGHLMDRMLNAYPQRQMAGFDISHSIVKIAQCQVTGPSFLQASADRMPWSDDSWDVVVVCEVMEHLEDPEAALRELHRITRRACLLSVPREPIWRVANMARGKYWGSLGNTPGHVQHWNTGDFVAFVSTLFDIKEVLTPFPWTMVWAEVKGKGQLDPSGGKEQIIKVR